MADHDRPDLRPRGRRYRFGWGTSSTKSSGPAVSADRLQPIDAVLLSHDHHADSTVPAAGPSVISRLDGWRAGHTVWRFR